MPRRPAFTRGCDGSQLPADVTLSGHLIGPECRFARTLPAKILFQFRGRGAGGELLAEAIVPDPCFWTPELPMLYRVEIVASGQWPMAREVVPEARGQGPGEYVERWFAIRRLGTRGTSLILDGKRWVLRGVCHERRAAGFIPTVDRGQHLLSPDLADLMTARAEDAALVVAAADEEFCLEASRQGVPLVVMVSGRGAELTDEFRRLGKWPAVFLVVLDPNQPADFDPRLLARNLLFAAHYRADKPLGSSTWTHAMWCEIEGELVPARYRRFSAAHHCRPKIARPSRHPHRRQRLRPVTM